MLLLLLLACIILIISASIHYRLHFTFRFRCCISSLSSIPRSTSISSNRSKSSPTPSNQQQSRNQCISDVLSDITTVQHQQHYGCWLSSVDGEEFNFFPSTFLFYIVFMICLCILIIIIDLISYYNHNESIIDLFFGYSIISYHNHSFYELHSMQSWNQSYSYYILEAILIFGVMILSIWESLFAFYRYYTAITATKKLIDHISSKTVIIKFILYYAIAFVILFAVQIFVYYWSFPIIITLNLSFNFYCSWRFTYILIERYKLFIEMDEKLNGNNEFETISNTITNQEILRKVYYMKYGSYICSILQSIYLSIFLVTYTVVSVYYLPILWSISCIINTMNFFRNHRFIHCQMVKIRSICTCKKNKHQQKMENRKQQKGSAQTAESAPAQTPKIQHINTTEMMLKDELSEKIKNNSSPKVQHLSASMSSLNRIGTKTDDFDMRSASMSSLNKTPPSHRTPPSPLLSFDIDSSPTETEQRNTSSRASKHQKGFSVPIPDMFGNNDVDENLNDAMESFNMLAKYGFCPRENLYVMQDILHRSMMHLKRPIQINQNENENKLYIK